MQFRPEPEISFNNINELAGLQRWLEGQFMAVFFGYNPNTPPDADVWTDMKPLPTYIPGFYLASTTVLGPIRLRQLRVGSDSCTVCPCSRMFLEPLSSNVCQIKPPTRLLPTQQR